MECLSYLYFRRGVMMQRNKLNPALVVELLRLTPAEITTDWLRTNLASFKEGPPRMDPFAEFDISKEAVGKAGNPTPNLTPAWSAGFKDAQTTVGRYVVNLLVLGGGENVRSKTPFYNAAFNKGTIGKMDNDMATLLLEDGITSEEYIDYLNRLFWIGYGVVSFASPSYDFYSMYSFPAVKKRKSELLKQYAGKLTAANVQKIENELMELARKELERSGAGGLDLYDSGYKAKTFENTYKNVAIMRGMVPRSDNESELELSTSNLTDGIEKDETHIYADMITTASFSAAVGTQIGGYETKKMNASFQSVTLDESGSDCGTKKGYTVKITDKNKGDFYLRYVVDKGKLVLLDSETLKKYVDQTVLMRSPMYCVSERICSKCAGELYYRMKIENVGLLCSRLSASLLNANLKKRHDMTVKVSKINVDKHFTLIK
jgi:hypothetical protein